MKPNKKRISKWLSTFGGIGILVIAAWVSVVLLRTPPKAKREKPVIKAPMVSVAPLNRGNEQVFIEAFGSVGAARELAVRSQVRGSIAEAHPHLAPGGTLEKGESLVCIEPADFEIAVHRAEAALTEAQVECEIEHGRQIVAKREWELLKGENGDPNQSSLALRKPQLQKVEAALAKAKADLDEARLDLERTSVKVPFDAVVIRESVETGQLIETQTTIAELAGTDEFWVEALVPVGRLKRISFPDNDTLSHSSQVEIRLDTGTKPVIRSGTVLRQLADLDPAGRMARVIVSIQDPLNLSRTPGVARLPLGSYVALEIEAGEMEDVVSIPRIALRENDEIWIADNENKLQIRPVTVVWRRDIDVLVSDLFARGDRVVTSHLSGVIPGMPLRIASLTPVLTKDQNNKPSPMTAKLRQTPIAP